VLGNSPIRLKLFLLGSRRFLSVWIMGRHNVMGKGFGSNNSDMGERLHQLRSNVSMSIFWNICFFLSLYQDIKDEVLRKIQLHKRKSKRKPSYDFPKKKMGSLYNLSVEDVMCFWKEHHTLKWLNASTAPFDRSPTVAKYFLGGPFIKGRAYDTCVVVSNAGDMLNSSLGAFIGRFRKNTYTGRFMSIIIHYSHHILCNR
jgi:hypothetical protein